MAHSEFNHSQSELVHFLQIWLVPDQKGVKPRYQQSHFSPAEMRGQLRLIVSPEGEEGALSVYQNVRVYAGCFEGDEQGQLKLGANRFAYVHIVCGAISINGVALKEGDGARKRDESLIDIRKGLNREQALSNFGVFRFAE